jgi:hypothetical protein
MAAKQGPNVVVLNAKCISDIRFSDGIAVQTRNVVRSGCSGCGATDLSHATCRDAGNGCATMQACGRASMGRIEVFYGVECLYSMGISLQACRRTATAFRLSYCGV